MAESLPPASGVPEKSGEIVVPKSANRGAVPSVSAWKIALAFGGSALSSVAVFALSQYLTARGFVSVTLARVLLIVAWLCISGLLVLVVKAFEIKRGRLIIFTGIATVAISLGGLEAWATWRTRPAIHSGDKSKLEAEMHALQLKRLKATTDFIISRRQLRETVERIELEAGCVIDTTGADIECTRRPPGEAHRSDFKIMVIALLVSESLDKLRFWLTSQYWRMPAPIAVYIRVTDESDLHQIRHAALEYESAKGWRELRIVDSLNGLQPDDKVVLTIGGAADPSMGFVVGKNTFQSQLYQKQFSHGGYVEGWLLAEYPKGITYGKSIGRLRISLLDVKGEWISSAIFDSHPGRGLQAVIPLDKKFETVNLLDLQETQ